MGEFGQRPLGQRPTVYIATLGNAPQVITLALDQLLPKHPFVEVCVIHTDDTPDQELPRMKFSNMHETIQQLDRQFQNLRPRQEGVGEKVWTADYRLGSRYYQFAYRRVLIQREEQKPGQLATYTPVKDVETESNSQAAFRTIFRVVQRYKEQRAIIHFNLAGGRKSMSVFAMSAAQILFTPGDKLWHVVSQNQLMETRAMHDTADGESYRLVPIPFVSVSTLNPVLGMLISSNDPYDIVQAQENYLHLMDLQRKEKFLRELDFDERQILLGVAQGLNNEEIGGRLKKRLSGKTVANKLTTIYETYIVSITEMPTDVTRPNNENMRAFLAAEFGAYFQQRGEWLEGNG
jgi:CRISPR-associated protein (TIGR02584 family)